MLWSKMLWGNVIGGGKMRAMMVMSDEGKEHISWSIK